MDQDTNISNDTNEETVNETTGDTDTSDNANTPPGETPVDEHASNDDEVSNLKSQNKILLGVAAVLGLVIVAMVGWLLWTNANDDTNAYEPDTNLFGELADYESDDNELIGEPNEPTDEPEVMPLAGPPDDFVVARINGIDIYASNVYLEFFRALDTLMWDYVAMFNDWEFDFTRDFGDGITFGRVVLEQAAKYAAETKLFLEVADELGVTVEEEQALVVAEYIDGLIQEHGRQELYEILWHDNIRDSDHLTELIAATFIVENLLGLLVGDDEAFARFEYYMDDDDATERASAILERIQAGEDFAELMHAYSEDPGLASYPNGYTFTHGDMVPAFEEATLAMEIGEISGLVLADHGYHIIMRVEPDRDDIFDRSVFHMGDGTDDLIGAKHILIMSPGLETLRVMAVLRGFEVMFEESDFELLPALDDVDVDRL